MAVIDDKPYWATEITQIDPNDPVQGGKGGVDNVPHEQLADRTKFLKKEIDDIKGETTEPMTLELLLQRIKGLEEAPAITLPVLPVGATFETTVVYTSGAEVAVAMGYGTWQPFAEGRVTVGVSSQTDDPDWTKVIGTEYGEAEVTLTVEQMPSHRHSLKHGRDNGSTDNNAGTIASDTGNWSGQNIPDSTIGSAGGNKAHNNIPPAVIVGKWVRTA